jgi:hypothetical protein
MMRLLRALFSFLRRLFARRLPPPREQAPTLPPSIPAPRAFEPPAPPPLEVAPPPAPIAASEPTKLVAPAPPTRARGPFPPPERSLGALRELPQRRWLEPRLLVSRVRDLGVARPRIFGLDDELRTPGEAEPLRLFADAPHPQKERRVRPRTPLARAPLTRLRTRNFRVDPRTNTSAIEEGLWRATPPIDWGWVHPDLRREVVDLDWMATDRISFLGPTCSEWFILWWDQSQKESPGAREAVLLELPRELDEALDQVKEQMLIRRDVKKDETQLEPAPLKVDGEIEAFTMAAGEDEPITKIIPEKTWVTPEKMESTVAFEARAREAYLQWRTLIGSLEER